MATETRNPLAGSAAPECGRSGQAHIHGADLTASFAFRLRLLAPGPGDSDMTLTAREMSVARADLYEQQALSGSPGDRASLYQLSGHDQEPITAKQAGVTVAAAAVTPTTKRLLDFLDVASRRGGCRLL